MSVQKPPGSAEVTTTAADIASSRNDAHDQTSSANDIGGGDASRGRSPDHKKKHTGDLDRRYLHTPRHSRPSRPLSPDALSILSTDEYEQLHSVPWPSYSTTNNLLRNQQQQQQHAPPATPPLTSRWRATLTASWIRNKGLAYMLLAQVFGVLMNVTTRLLEVEGNKGKGLDPFQILFARMGITVVLASAWMWWKKTPDFPLGKKEVRGLLAARGFGGFFGVFGMYYSLQYLPLADCTVLTFLAPGLVCWVCSLLLKEPFTRIEQIATVVSFTGVILIARPTSFFSSNEGEAPPEDPISHAPANNNGTKSPSDASDYDNVTPEQRLAAVGIAMVGVCGTVMAFTTIRWIGQRAHPLISVNYFAAWCTIVSFVMQLVLPGVGFVLPADAKEWGYLIFLGICGFIMQFLLAAGLSYEKSSRATNMTYTQMLFALSFDKFFFGHSPSWTSILGSTLILGPAVFVAMQKNVEESKEGRNDGASEIDGDEEAQRGLLGSAEIVAEEEEEEEEEQRMAPPVRMGDLM